VLFAEMKGSMELLANWQEAEFRHGLFSLCPADLLN
jgi:hypothetical protein